MNINKIFEMTNYPKCFNFIPKYENYTYIYELRLEERSLFWNLYLIYKLQQYEKYNIHISYYIISKFIDQMSQYRVLVNSVTQKLIFEPLEFKICDRTLTLKKYKQNPHNIFSSTHVWIALFFMALFCFIIDI